ncbi:hypothetical protein ACP4OV_001450 [Aristida adscensionis]
MSNRNRTPLRDITNGNKDNETNEERRKREERNRYQREYRARKKAESANQNQSSSASSVLCDTPSKERGEKEEERIKREERNRYQREYRARKKAELVAASPSNQMHCSAVYNTPVTTTPMSIATPVGVLTHHWIYAQPENMTTPPNGGVEYPTVQQPSVTLQDKENCDTHDGTMEWLHRNDNYVRGSSNVEKHLINANRRQRYHNLDASSREVMLRKKRESFRQAKKRKAQACLESDYPSMAEPADLPQYETLHTPAVQRNSEDDNADDVEFDSQLYEPIHTDFGFQYEGKEIPPIIVTLHTMLRIQGGTAQSADLEEDINEVENQRDDEEDNDIQGDTENSPKYVSAREYYAFKLQARRGLFNILLFGARLFQQWAVDIYIKIESMRLDWYSNPDNQKLIRAELYQGVVDVVSAGETRASEVGKRIVLPRSFPGGDRDMQQRFLNAMALVQRFGKPDYFITMTCNPNWEEIITNLEPGQTPQDRLELVARVYRAKLRAMKDLLVKKRYFGEVAAYAHVTDFQKRGLPHEHILLIMKSGSKLTTPDGYDKVISAEIPDKDKYPVLHDLVINHMLHGPCGVLNKNCPCMVDGECRFQYPRQFCAATQQGKDSYPLYRRSEDGQKVKIRGAELDNRWVVPYNPGLLMRFNCHINVEACGSIKAVKYLFKYVYKGHDHASFSVDPSEHEGGVINEIRQYRDARYISPPDAVYRILGFSLFGIYPSVLQLQLHLPNMQYVTYDGSGNLEDVVRRPSSSMTTLTEYFKMNRTDSFARTLLYKDFPEHYRWIKKQKKWQRRKTKAVQIGQIVYAHPAEGERYYLRVLLNHVRGATSYEDLRTVAGIPCSTFREACEKRGLIETDRSLDDSLSEAATFQMPCALRRLFATILVFCEATNIVHCGTSTRNQCLKITAVTTPTQQWLSKWSSETYVICFIPWGRILETTVFLRLMMQFSNDNMREVREELSVGVDQEHLNIHASLNKEQLAGYRDIIHHVFNKKSRVFYVDGPGGTGKTFLYKALLAKVRSEGLIAIATATSGIAASILPGGRTAHSRFKIPIKLADNTMCNFAKQSGIAELLRRASLIIWDEVAMTKRQAVETLDRSLQDIMDCSLPFGGKVMVFGGDFR